VEAPGRKALAHPQSSLVKETRLGKTPSLIKQPEALKQLRSDPKPLRLGLAPLCYATFWWQVLGIRVSGCVARTWSQSCLSSRT
jgi:hypothetical protein